MVEKKYHGLNDLAALKVYYSILNGDKSIVSLKRIVLPEAPRLHQKYLHDIAYDYYHGLSKVSWKSFDEPEVIEVRDYLKQRGFTAKALSEVGAKMTLKVFRCVDIPLNISSDLRQCLGDSGIRSSAYQ